MHVYRLLNDTDKHTIIFLYMYTAARETARRRWRNDVIFPPVVFGFVSARARRRAADKSFVSPLAIFVLFPRE